MEAFRYEHFVRNTFGQDTERGEICGPTIALQYYTRERLFSYVNQYICKTRYNPMLGENIVN